MYWPLAAPNVYALTKHSVSRSGFEPSRDGLPVDEAVANRSPAQHDALSPSGADAASEFEEHEIIDVKVSRGGAIFASITRTTLTIWQTKPVVALAAIERSAQSVKSYGNNTALVLRPDALIIVLQTSQGYLITYSLATDPSVKVYETRVVDSNKHMRKSSVDGYNNLKRPASTGVSGGPGEGDGIREVNIRFRMVVRIDAGISNALAREDELVVATQKPSALQCIRWVAESGVSQTSTELVTRMSWIGKRCTIVEMLHDRPMDLTTWITSDGRAFAVSRRTSANPDPDNAKALFTGSCFREPTADQDRAVRIAVNARFSLVAIGCEDGNIDVYAVKDHIGNIAPSHKMKLPISSIAPGRLNCLLYSPDGYCLFAGYERGWAIWSVYGKPGVNTFSHDQEMTSTNDESWLQGIKSAFWIGNGCELALLPMNDNRLWFLNVARSAITSCFSPPNVSRGLLFSSNSIMVYKGHDVQDVMSLPSDMPLLQTIQIPPYYLNQQWPIKQAVISADGKYVAVAGRRGLAHYSLSSNRWKTFDDPHAENEFSVRGGMCWYQHILIASVEAGNRPQIRLYSRDKSLSHTHIQHVEDLPAAAISTTVSGSDSILVFTHDNTLLHFVIVIGASTTARLVQMGQIGFHGIIRAPSRVRAISWVIPEEQTEHGDPSQDVTTASVLFLIDGKLVLLQPSTNDRGELKYDMRVVAHNVEYYLLLRDQPSITNSLSNGRVESPAIEINEFGSSFGHSLRESIWFFDGSTLNLWSDIQDVLACAPTDLERDLPQAVSIPVEFYPLCTVVAKGIIAGIDSELIQRRDINFSFFRHAARTQLFLPHLLKYHLGEFNTPAALHLSNSYQHLPYFSHGLEVLLHNVLDAEVDHPPSMPEAALLPPVLSFLSVFKSYLDIVVNCTRKTELRSWETLFSYLPPVMSLFEQSLAENKWNTAAGYLLVLYAFEQDPKDKEFQVHEFARLLRLAGQDGAWEICMEVSRFLLGIDASGETLRTALAEAGLSRESRNGVSPQLASVDDVVAQHSIEDQASSPGAIRGGSVAGLSSEATSRAASISSPLPGLDYFSSHWRKDR
jgi:hypothetical protein